MTNQQIAEQNARRQRIIDESNAFGEAGNCPKCGQPVIKVLPSFSNGWVSYQHRNHKWDASHDAEVK